MLCSCKMIGFIFFVIQCEIDILAPYQFSRGIIVQITYMWYKASWGCNSFMEFPIMYSISLFTHQMQALIYVILYESLSNRSIYSFLDILYCLSNIVQYSLQQTNSKFTVYMNLWTHKVTVFYSLWPGDILMAYVIMVNIVSGDVLLPVCCWGIICIKGDLHSVYPRCKSFKFE